MTNEENPFARPRPEISSKMILGGALALATVAGSVAAYSLYEAPKQFGATSIVSQLQDTDWSLKAERGYQRFGSILSDDVQVSFIALGQGGELALIPEGRPTRIVLWRVGQVAVYHLDRRRLTALAIDPEGRVHFGDADGFIGRIDVGARPVVLEPALAEGTSIVGFSFAGSSLSAVRLSGGEVRLAERPFAVNQLRTLRMPAGFQTKVMGFNADNELVVGGDTGAVHVWDGSSWEARPISNRREVLVMGRDGHGQLLVGQERGAVFREAGLSWEPLGEAPATPRGIGEHPVFGVVMVAIDGSLWRRTDDEEWDAVPVSIPAVEPSAASNDGNPATAWHVSIAGHNVVYVKGGRAVVHDGETVWAHTEISAGQRDCRPATFESPGFPALVRCAAGLYSVTAEGVEPTTEPEGFRLSMVGDHQVSGFRQSRWRNEHELWVADKDGVGAYARQSVLRVHRPGTADVVANWPQPRGPLMSFDVNDRFVWVALRSGELIRAPLNERDGPLEAAGGQTTDTVELSWETVIDLENVASRVPTERLRSFRVLAAPSGAWTFYGTSHKVYVTHVGPSGELGETVALPRGSAMVRTRDRIFVLHVDGTFELVGAGHEPPYSLQRVQFEGLELEREFVGDPWLASLDETFAFANGDKVTRCRNTECENWTTPHAFVRSLGLNRDSSIVTIGTDGTLGYIPPPANTATQQL